MNGSNAIINFCRERAAMVCLGIYEIINSTQMNRNHKKELHLLFYHTAQKMNFLIKGFFSQCDQIHSFLWIWSQLLKKSLLMENFIFWGSVIPPWQEWEWSLIRWRLLSELIFQEEVLNRLLETMCEILRTICEIRSKLIVMTPKRRHWCWSGVFIVNFE